MNEKMCHKLSKFVIQPISGWGGGGGCLNPILEGHKFLILSPPTVVGYEEGGGDPANGAKIDLNLIQGENKVG